MPWNVGGGDEFCDCCNLRRLQWADYGCYAAVAQEFGGCAACLFRVGRCIESERQDFDIGRRMVCQGGAHCRQRCITTLAVQPFEGRQKSDFNNGSGGSAGREQQAE